MPKSRSVLIISEDEHWVPGDTLWPTGINNDCFYRLDRINPDKTVDLFVYRMNGGDSDTRPSNRLMERKKTHALNGVCYLTKDFWKSAIFDERY